MKKKEDDEIKEMRQLKGERLVGRVTVEEHNFVIHSTLHYLKKTEPAKGRYYQRTEYLESIEAALSVPASPSLELVYCESEGEVAASVFLLLFSRLLLLT